MRTRTSWIYDLKLTLSSPGPSIVGGVHWTTNESLDNGSESEDDIGSIAPPHIDDSSR